MLCGWPRLLSNSSFSLSLTHTHLLRCTTLSYEFGILIKAFVCVGGGTLPPGGIVK